MPAANKHEQQILNELVTELLTEVRDLNEKEMKRQKCFIVEHRADGVTTTVTSFRPYHTEVSVVFPLDALNA
jgi:hypothetical protein